MSTKTQKIAIIGGGPGGLTLGCILAQSKINVTIYEKDTNANARTQGGTLDIHEDGGQLALKDANLYNEFLKHARYEGQDFKIITKTMEPVLDVKGDVGDQSRPEIDRETLRNMLLNSFGRENIRWNHHVASIQPSNSDGRYDILFKNGSIDRGFDLIVGADGAWSKVRPLISNSNPFYSNISIVEIAHNSTAVSKTSHLAINNLVQRGSGFAFNDQRGVMGQRLGDNSIKVYVAFWVDDESWINKEFDTAIKDPAAMRIRMMSHFEGWSPEITDIIRLCDDEPIKLRPLYMLPVGHSWEAKKGLTLLGDAAHLMTPFAGEGVNLALVDALHLSQAIKKAATGEQELNDAVKDYETEMFERAGKSAEHTKQNMVNFFSPDFPETVKALMKMISSAHEQPDAGSK